MALLTKSSMKASVLQPRQNNGPSVAFAPLRSFLSICLTSDENRNRQESCTEHEVRSGLWDGRRSCSRSTYRECVIELELRVGPGELREGAIKLNRTVAFIPVHGVASRSYGTASEFHGRTPTLDRERLTG